MEQTPYSTPFPLSDLVGQTIGAYKIVKAIGRGGMGLVFEAVNNNTREQVALKIPHPSMMADKDYLEKFYREAEIAARVVHRNVIQTIEVAEKDGYHYIAMELFKGRPLSMVVNREGGLSVVRAVKIARHIASGLTAVHNQHIVHGDIKPKNVMVTDRDFAKLMDFGMARKVIPGVEDDLDIDNWGGSRAYLAPEQCGGKAGEYRSDIYQLGVTFFEMLTGRVPFLCDDPNELLKKIVNDPVPEIAEECPDAPPEVQDVIDMCLAKEPGDRYAKASEVEEDLLDLHAVLGGTIV